MKKSNYVPCNKVKTDALIKSVRLAIDSALSTGGKKYIILPQGTGKTYNTLEVALEKYGASGVFFITPTLVNARDYERKFSRFFSKETPFNAVHISAVWRGVAKMTETEGKKVDSTLVDDYIRNLEYSGVKVIIVDECHEITSSNYGEAVKELIKSWNGSVLGLSPYSLRLTIGLDLKKRLWWNGIFDEQPIYSLDYDNAWSSGILAFPYVETAITKNKDDVCKQVRSKLKDTKGVPKRKIDDFVRDKYNTAFSKYTISGALAKVSSNVSSFPDSEHFSTSDEQLEFWLFSKDLKNGDEDSIFNYDCANTAEQLAEFYNISISDISVYKLHTFVKNSDEVIDNYNNDKTSKVKILASVNMANKGIHPENLSGTILCRHTESVELLLQMCLRDSHIYYTNQPVIIDVVDTAGYINCIQTPSGKKPERDNTKFNELEQMLRDGKFKLLTGIARDTLNVSHEFRENSDMFFNEAVKLAKVLSSSAKTLIINKYMLYSSFTQSAKPLSKEALYLKVARALNEDVSVVRAVMTISDMY